MKITDILDRIFSWKHTYPILTLNLIVLLVTRNVFKGGSFGSWDSFGGHIALISFFSEGSRAFDMWNETSFGFFTPLNFVKFLAIITKISGDAILVFNFTIILTMLGTAAGMYFFAYHFTDDRGASFASAFLFTFNQWIVAKYSSGHMMHLFPYFLLPLLFFFLYKSITSGRLKYIILLSLIFSLYPFMRLDPLYYVLPFVIIYFLTYVISIFSSAVVKRAIKVVLVSMPLFILLTVFLFLPVQRVPTMFSSVEYPLEEIELNSLDIYNNILGQTTSIYSNIFWGAGITWETHPFLPLLAYKLFMLIIPALAFSALIFRRNIITIYFTIMALLSVFLAKGPQEPFAGIYLWAYNNIPYFSGLHVPNRWLIITWFAYAFLAGITIAELTKLMKYKFSSASKVLSAVLVLIAVFSVFIGSYYIFTQGYETSRFPYQEIELHDWLKKNDEEFRLASVPFSQTYAFLEGGTMEQDFGKSSYFYHKKPIINTIFGVSFNDRVSDFPDFIKDRVNNREGVEIGKILGIYDVRYFVLQGYPPTVPYAIGRLTYSEHDYFERQKGLVKVFEGNYTPYTLKVADYYPPDYVKKKIPVEYRTIEVKRPAKIFENSYWTPRIFAPQNRMLVVGGMDSFLKLAEIESFNFSEWDMLFADDLAQKLGKDALKQQSMGADIVTFVNSEPLDLAMFISNSTSVKIKDCNGSWKGDKTPIIQGLLVYGRDILFSDKSGEKTNCQIDVKEDAEYEVWVRVFYSKNVGELKVNFDGKYTGGISPKSSSPAGFKWVRLSREYLNAGTHTVELTNEASGSGKENRLNGIVIVQTGEIERALQEVRDMIGKKSVYLLDEDVRDNLNIPEGNVILYSKNGLKEKSNIISAPPLSVKFLEFNEIQPSKWIVKVNSTTPYTLVFSNSYHPMWRAYVNGKEYSSFPSYYFINSFQINETGEQEVVIEFIGQRIQNISLLISGLAYLGCFGYLFFDWRWGKGDKWTIKLKNKFLRIIKRERDNNDQL